MKQAVLDYLSNQCQRAENVAACRLDSKRAEVRIDLDSGQSVTVYVTNGSLRVLDIEARFQQNTRRKIHTLYLVDGQTMPDDQTEVEPSHWMYVLHTLTHGRIYAYWCDDGAVTIRPIHIEWKWGDSARRVHYGPNVELNALRPQMVECASKFISGWYAMADFGEGAFWKKRDPADGRQYKYSWRQWTFGGQKKKTAQEPQADWDPWKEFVRHYGSVGGHEAQYTYNYRRRRYTNGNRQQPAADAPVERRHYTTLGVATTASYEEVKQAYRRKARENHPDMHPKEKDKYTARMADINAAFEAITRKMK